MGSKIFQVIKECKGVFKGDKGSELFIKGYIHKRTKEGAE